MRTAVASSSSPSTVSSATSGEEMPQAANVDVTPATRHSSSSSPSTDSSSISATEMSQAAISGVTAAATAAAVAAAGVAIASSDEPLSDAQQRSDVQQQQQQQQQQVPATAPTVPTEPVCTELLWRQQRQHQWRVALQEQQQQAVAEHSRTAPKQQQSRWFWDQQPPLKYDRVLLQWPVEDFTDVQVVVTLAMREAEQPLEELKVQCRQALCLPPKTPIMLLQNIKVTFLTTIMYFT
jgi:hypothetical protein